MANIPFVHITNPGKYGSGSTSSPSSPSKSGSRGGVPSVGSGIIPGDREWRGAESDIAIDNINREEKEKKQTEQQHIDAGQIKVNGKWVDKPKNFDKYIVNDDKPEILESKLKPVSGHRFIYTCVNPETNEEMIFEYLLPRYYVSQDYPNDNTPMVRCKHVASQVSIPLDVYQNGKYVFLARLKKDKTGYAMADFGMYVLNVETQEMYYFPAPEMIVDNNGKHMDVFYRDKHKDHHVFQYDTMKEIKTLSDDPDDVM